MSDDSTPPEFDRLYTVKVSNLSYATTEEQLERMFRKYGTIGLCYIAKNPLNNRSRGFGYVKFHRRSPAVEAAYRLRGEILDGRVIELSLTDRSLRRSLARRMRRSRSSSSRSSSDDEHMHVTVKVENLHYTTDEWDLKDKFYTCGPIADIYIPRIPHTGLNRGYAFVKFYRKHDATFAQETMNRSMLNGRRIRVGLARYGRPPFNRRYPYGAYSSNGSRSHR